MFIENFKVESPNVKYGDGEIESVYNYETTELVHENRDGSYQWIVKPKIVQYNFKTNTNAPKLGVMLVGWGGNNGSTLTAGVIANREGISWVTKDKIQRANYFGSLTQASTIRVGSFNGEEIYAPFKSLLPMVNPDDIIFGGWDISNMNLADAMARAKVLDIDLQKQLRPYMESMVPLPGIFDPDFVAANQGSRANNVIKGTKKDQVQQIIKDIREFKGKNKVDKVVVLWTANTERYSNVIVGLNDTMENLLTSLDKNEHEISPSTLYGIACAMENIPYINGSPQNTFVPGLIELAIQRNSLIGGDDFKSGQTKMKSVLVDFLVGAGIKPTSIVSYNHLGNNDGMNLSAPQTFRSKEISKSNVVDDMVSSNGILYEPGEHPDHVIVIKVNPDDIIFGGWDISNKNLAVAMARAKVLDIDLQKQLRPYMESMVPLPGIFDPDFVAANQGSRANNVIKGTKKEQVQQIIKDIREFKGKNKVVVLWTANTEMYSNVIVGLNDTMENLLASLDKNEHEISPSTLYGIACTMENIPYINGSPQNTFVPGLIELAIQRNSFIGGDDFKSGQTKMKSDFLVGAGIKPTSIVSYNHLGNNDGMDLSAPRTFRSKEISKSNVVDDMVSSNGILYESSSAPMIPLLSRLQKTI